MTTLYGITTIYSKATNPCRRAELIDYPIPLLLSYDDCVAYIAKYYSGEFASIFHPKIESERVCWLLVKMMVECHSGRRIVSNGNMIVVNEGRPTYEQLLERSHRFSGAPWKEREDRYLSLYREKMIAHARSKQPKPKFKFPPAKKADP